MTKKRRKTEENLREEEVLGSEIPLSEEELEGAFSSQQESLSELLQSDYSGESDSFSNDDIPQKFSSEVETITQTYQRAILQIQTRSQCYKENLLLA